MAAASASTSPALHCSTVSPSTPVTSGNAPPSVATSGVPGAHRLDRRQAEAFVQARHDGHLGLGVELDDALVGDTRDELDVRTQTE